MSAPAITRELTAAAPMDRPAVFTRVLEQINAALERRFWIWAAALTIMFVGGAVVDDIRKPMWTDELITLRVAQQSSLADVVKATVDHADSAPPLYASIVHVLLPVTGNDALAVRVASTLGFGVMVLCLMAFCRGRLPAAYAIAAALLASQACVKYASEGRGYGVMLAGAAGAMLCWQCAVEGRRRKLAIPLFALCMAVTPALHYYCIFFLAPFFLAEMVRWRTSGKADIALLAALAPALLVLALHYPIIAATASFKAHYWSPAGLRRIPEFYGECFIPMLSACVLPVGIMAVFAKSSPEPEGSGCALTAPEWTVISALSAMPVCVIVLAKFTTHVFVSRYVIWSVPAIAVLVVALLCLAARARADVGVSLLAVLLAFTALTVSGYLLTLRERPPLKEGDRVLRGLAALPAADEPIVVADPHVFMEVAYYAPAPIARRLVCPTSRELELRYFGKDSASLFLSGMRRHTKLRIAPYETVVAQPRFLLAELSSNPLPWELTKQGYRVMPIGVSPDPVLFEVEAPQP